MNVDAASLILKHLAIFYSHKMYKSRWLASHDTLSNLSCVGIGSLRWSCSLCCVGWQMNFSSDRSPGSRSFLSSASCPSRTTRGSWVPPGRSSSCWPVWRSTAPRCSETSPASPTNTPRQTKSCRGEEHRSYVLFTALSMILKHSSIVLNH